MNLSTEDFEHVQQLLREAYIAGANDVHENYQEDAEADFAEAADDYVKSITI